jgi:hypothetical protein
MDGWVSVKWYHPVQGLSHSGDSTCVLFTVTVGIFQRPPNTKVVTPGTVQDNLKETTNKGYQVGWQASQHTGTITLNQQPKADLHE